MLLSLVPEKGPYAGKSVFYVCKQLPCFGNTSQLMFLYCLGTFFSLLNRPKKGERSDYGKKGKTGPFHPWRKEYKRSKGIGDLCPYLSHGVENQVREVWVEGFHAVRATLMEPVGPHGAPGGQRQGAPTKPWLDRGWASDTKAQGARSSTEAPGTDTRQPLPCLLPPSNPGALWAPWAWRHL